MAKTILTFSLDSERDRDILVYFGSLSSGERSLKFREIARRYISNSQLDRIERKIIKIEGMLESGIVTVEYSNVEESDDPRIRIAEAVLKDLGK